LLNYCSVPYGELKQYLLLLSLAERLCFDMLFVNQAMEVDAQRHQHAWANLGGLR